MSAWTRIEYGVIVDRTRDGLGYYLHSTWPDLDRAGDAVAAALARYDRRSYPVAIRQRTVTATDWQGVALGGAS